MMPKRPFTREARQWVVDHFPHNVNDYVTRSVANSLVRKAFVLARSEGSDEVTVDHLERANNA